MASRRVRAWGGTVLFLVPAAGRWSSLIGVPALLVPLLPSGGPRGSLGRPGRVGLRGVLLVVPDPVAVQVEVADRGVEGDPGPQPGGARQLVRGAVGG